jgi:hypothetical protein
VCRTDARKVLLHQPARAGWSQDESQPFLQRRSGDRVDLRVPPQFLQRQREVDYADVPVVVTRGEVIEEDRPGPVGALVRPVQVPWVPRSCLQRSSSGAAESLRQAAGGWPGWARLQWQAEPKPPQEPPTTQPPQPAVASAATEPPAGPNRTSGDGGPGDATASPAGPRYVLGEEMARGGMGVVYRATDRTLVLRRSFGS